MRPDEAYWSVFLVAALLGLSLGFALMKPAQTPLHIYPEGYGRQRSDLRL